eukprot:scaffold17472_cov105-Isochrysis_galbana.AAC.2
METNRKQKNKAAHGRKGKGGAHSLTTLSNPRPRPASATSDARPPLGRPRSCSWIRALRCLLAASAHSPVALESCRTL